MGVGLACKGETMSDKDYRARLDEIIKATPDELTLGQQYGRTRALCRELIAEVNRLNQVIELNNATMRDAF